MSRLIFTPIRLFGAGVFSAFRAVSPRLGISAEKVTELVSNIEWIAGYWQSYPVRLLILLVFTPLNAYLSFLFPYYMRHVVNEMEQSVTRGVAPDYLPLLSSLLMLGLGATVTYILLQSTRAYINMSLEWKIRTKVFRQITDMGNSFFTKYRTGDVITRFTDDLDKVSFFSCSQVFRAYEALLYIAAALFFMFKLSTSLTFYALIPLPLMGVILALTDSRLAGLFERLQGTIGRVNNHLEVCFSGIRVLRTYRCEERQCRAFEELTEERKVREIRAAAGHSFSEHLYMALASSTVLLVLLLGGFRVIDGRIDSGTFLSFLLILMIVSGKFFELGWIAISGRRALVSATRIRTLGETEPDVREDAAPLVFTGLRERISFDGVGFGYNGSTEDALSGISFNIAKGSRVAIVGPVGSGKSTLVGLIPRLYDATQGIVALDGVDIREFRLRELREHIGYVPQEAQLFSGTIEDNVVFGRQGVTQEAMERACRVSQFSNDLKSFPDGLNTMVGHRGLTLSGGQKQRLALARALAGAPEILILDDCSSALDADTEARLWKALSRETPGMTVLLISHRIATVRRADQIVVLDGGRISGTGTHDQLLESGDPVYTRLYKAQTGE